MTDTDGTEARPRRRTQSQRSEDTRHRILEATIRCLYRSGYSAVSFAMVAEEASVSRGLITYHFDTKADLMVAVRDAVYLEERRLVEEAREQLGTQAYLRQLPRIVLQGMRREPAIAVNEILLAARADPDLGRKLRAGERAIEAHTLDAQRAYYHEIGREPPEDLAIMCRVAVATFRGLAIAELVMGEEAEVDACTDYVMRLIQLTSHR